jgi:hypothetical protein
MKDKGTSEERLRRELNEETNRNVYVPYERNHQFKVTISKNDSEKQKAKTAKSQWKSAARSKYGNNWKTMTRKNGYAV